MIDSDTVDCWCGTNEKHEFGSKDCQSKEAIAVINRANEVYDDNTGTPTQEGVGGLWLT